MSEPRAREQRGADTPELSYEHLNSAPPPPRENGRRGVLLYSKASIYGAIFLGLNLTLLSVLLVFNADALYVGEDGLLENSATFLFFLTALLLLAIAVLGRGAPGRWLYLLGALAFLFATGEEISWGQRILGWETPHWLGAVNVKNETNLHNIEWAWGPIHRGYRVGTMLLCVATGAAYFARKSRVFGVPLPSFLLLCCFLVTYAYRPRDLVGVFPLSIVYGQHLLLLLFAAYACFSRDRRLFTLSVLFLAVIILEQFLLHQFNPRPAPPWEAGEYLFSIACFVYAAELFLTHRAVVEKNVRAAYRAVSQARQ